MIKTAVALPEHKVTDADITPELKAVAEDYARTYCGNFSYMVQMTWTVTKYKRLSPKQAAGVLNCLKAQIKIEQKQQEEALAALPVIDEETGVVIMPEPEKMLPIGIYTIAWAESARVTVRIKKLLPQELSDNFYMKNGVEAGSLKIQVLTGPDNESCYTTIGLQKANGKRWMYKKAANFEMAIESVEALLDPETAKLAGYEYAVKSSKCFRCNKTLTVPASIHNGMGADCASKSSF